MNISQIFRAYVFLEVLIFLVLQIWPEALVSSKAESTLTCTQEYLCQSKPGDQAVVFAPGVISTGLSERDMTISPDGGEMYYSVFMDQRGFIIRLHRENNGWSRPEVAWFSGRYSDLEPAFSPDGNRLFFVSNRPVSGRGEPKKDFDIWYIEKKKSGWSTPKNPGPPLNSSQNEFYPSVTRDGSIYFCADLKTSLGGEDIFKSNWIQGKYSRPVNVSAEINTKGQEFNAFVAPDESYLIFTTTGRGPGVGGGDLWVSFQEKGSWTSPVNLGVFINSASLEYCPFVSSDGEYLFFTSRRSKLAPYSTKPIDYTTIKQLSKEYGNGQSDIYWVSTKQIARLRGNPVGVKKDPPK